MESTSNDTKIKMEWKLEWEITVNGNKEIHKRVYKTFDQAKTEVRKLITSSCSDSTHIKRKFSYILKGKDLSQLRKAIVWFILQYLTKEDFQLKEPIEKLSNALAKVDISPCLEINKDEVKLYNYDGYMVINTDMLMMEDEKKRYVFTFSPTFAGGLELLDIRLEPLEYGYDKAAYPLLVLRTLIDSTEHLSQREIRSALISKFNFTGERKAIGRHINLLKELDFGIKHDGKGYYIDRERSISGDDLCIIKNALDAYTEIDDNKKTEIISRLSK